VESWDTQFSLAYQKNLQNRQIESAAKLADRLRPFAQYLKLLFANMHKSYTQQLNRDSSGQQLRLVVFDQIKLPENSSVDDELQKLKQGEVMTVSGYDCTYIPDAPSLNEVFELMPNYALENHGLSITVNRGMWHELIVVNNRMNQEHSLQLVHSEGAAWGVYRVASGYTIEHVLKHEMIY